MQYKVTTAKLMNDEPPQLARCVTRRFNNNRNKVERHAVISKTVYLICSELLYQRREQRREYY